MPRRPPNAVLLLAIALATAAVQPLAARAGQVRIDVGAGTGIQFLPTNPQLNLDDHVVWVWVGSMPHTVTSGSGCTANGMLFNTPSGVSTQRFSWKSSQTGATPYVCLPHCPTMAGTLNISASGVNVSDFRISEVHFAAQGFIEIANIGAVQGNLGQYRLSIQGGAPLLLNLVNIVVPANNRVVVHLNQAGTNTATDIFFQGITLPRSGSAALYVPNTVFPALTDPDMMVDFVQWGAGGQPLENVADQANYWTAGSFVEVVADGHSIAYCPGTPGQRDAAAWLGIAVPTPHTSDCTTPALRPSWGRLKLIHR